MSRGLITIEFPWASPSLNTVLSWNRRHWAIHKRHKDTWSDWMSAYLIKHYPVLVFNKDKFSKVKITRVSSRKIRDRDNLIGGCKFIVDLLVEYGLLVDDDEKWAEVEYTQERLTEGKPRTLVDIDWVKKNGSEIKAKKTVGDRIKEVRVARGVSQAKLSKAAGVFNDMISKYERGQTTPTEATVGKLAAQLGVSVLYLLGGDSG